MSQLIRRCAVVGNPIAHSRSPDIHRQFAQSTGINLDYSTLLAPLDGFAATVAEFFAAGGTGLNVTVPFKEQAYTLCTQLSAEAQAAKAVNTLMLNNGALYGHNTDGIGLVNALQQHTALTNKSVLILGAGGATRGVILPLLQAGVSHISIANRTVDKAVQLIADMVAINPNFAQQLTALALSDIAITVDIAINATSATYITEGQGLVLPAGLQFALGYEMAYGKPSSFISYAQQLNAPVYDGLSMLIGQAAASFALWFGVMPSTSHIVL